MSVGSFLNGGFVSAFERVLLLFVAVVIGSSGCSSPAKLVAVQEGVASWYGPGFHGKKTANGEKYDQNAMTAAHKTLPFGTLVKVVHRQTGKSVMVRVNDRGPYAHGRIIDLSKAAATKLGMMRTGTAQVKLYVAAGKESHKAVRSARAGEQFSVQVGSYYEEAPAKKKAAAVPQGFVHKSKTDGKTVFRVMSGRFSSKDEAERHRRHLAAKKVNGFVKQLQN